MNIYILSILGILLENSIFFGGNQVFFVALPFFSYVLLKRKADGIFTLLGIVFLLSMHGGHYVFFFSAFTLYACLGLFLSKQMEYNRGTVLYLTVIECLFYALLVRGQLTAVYGSLHAILFLGLNYIYLKDCYKE